MKNKSRLQSLWLYLKNPTYDIEEDITSFWHKIFDIFKYWSLGMFIAVVASLISARFMGQFGLDDSQNILKDFFSDNSILVIAIVVFFWGPFSEEMTFRLFMKYSAFRFGFFLSFLTFMLFELLASYNSMVSQAVDKILNSYDTARIIGLIIFALVFLGFTYGYIIKKTKLNKLLGKINKKYFKYLFYTSVILFGTVHFFNFANFRELWFVLPLLVAPQLLLGFILSYVRMSYGLHWSVFYHFLHNTLASLPLIFFSQINDSSLTIIQESNNWESSQIPKLEKIYFIAGSISSLIILIIFLLAFYLLITEHRKYKKEI